MEILDDKTYAKMQDAFMKSNNRSIDEQMQELIQQMAQNRHKENIDYDEKTMTALYTETLGPYHQYASEFYHENLRKEVKITRNFLPETFRKSMCIQNQTEINDIVHNIRKALSISYLGKIHSKNNILIKNYINGNTTLCKQTIMTLISSFGGIANFMNGVKRGCAKHYEHEQMQLAIIILKHFFAFPNILKKICTTNEIFESFCQFWINFIGRNCNGKFPVLLKNDKYEMELHILELSCLFLRTSYCWIKPKHNKYIIHSIEKNKIFKVLCQWLSERTSNWNHHRISMLTVLSHKNPDDKYANICHQTNYIFQCLIYSIKYASLRMINGGKRSLSAVEVKKLYSMEHKFTKCMIKNNLGSACMESIKSDLLFKTPDGNVHEAFPGIKFKELNKIRIKWKYKLLECQSSKCQMMFNETNCKLKKCSGCLTTFYCSRFCQKYDWKYKHRFECNNI